MPALRWSGFTARPARAQVGSSEAYDFSIAARITEETTLVAMGVKPKEREREREINGRWKWTDREHYHLTAFVADELRGTIRDFRMSDRQDQSFAWATKREVDRHRAALQIFTKRDRGRMACAERVAAFLNKIGCAATYKQGDRRQGPSQRYSRLVVKVAAITGRGSLTGQRSREASLAERMTKTLAPGDMGGQHAGLLRFQTLRVLCPCR